METNRLGGLFPGSYYLGINHDRTVPEAPYISFSTAVVGQPNLFHQHQVPQEFLLRFIIREICVLICGYEYFANIETHYVDHAVDPSSVVHESKTHA